MGRLPVTVLTGFLGSGKTTVLRHLLPLPEMAGTACVINEFGTAGLDDIIVDDALVAQADETLVLMNSGCLCCTIRGDLARTLMDLVTGMIDGTVPIIDRIVIETTGLADPAPILHTLMSDADLLRHFRMDGIVTTVDAVHAGDQLDAQVECAKQVSVADRLLITKSDLVDEVALAALNARLARLNPGAPVVTVVNGEVAPDQILDCGLFDPKRKSPDVAAWLRAEAVATPHNHHDHSHGDHDPSDHDHGGHDPNRHDDRIGSFVIRRDEPMAWEAFLEFASTLITHYGDRLLRLKGIVWASESALPIVVHGVQHMFHPPASLSHWPDEKPGTTLVLITRDLKPETVKEMFEGIVARFTDHAVADRPQYLEAVNKS